MNAHVIIGTARVLIQHHELLPCELNGLRRANAVPGDGRFETVLTIERPLSRDWEIEIREQDGVHYFGRPEYVMEVDPGKLYVNLRLLKAAKDHDTYWLQRDIFGVLACLSG